MGDNSNQYYVSGNEAKEMCKKMAANILDLERRLFDVHQVARHGVPDKWYKRLLPGYTQHLRLKHVVGLTAPFVEVMQQREQESATKKEPMLIFPPRDIIAPDGRTA